MGQQGVQQILQGFIDLVHVTAQDAGHVGVELSDGPVGADGHVFLHDAGEHGVVGLPVGHMVGGAQGVAQKRGPRRSRRCKGDAAVGAGHEEVLEQGDAGLGPLSRISM